MSTTKRAFVLKPSKLSEFTEKLWEKSKSEQSVSKPSSAADEGTAEGAVCAKKSRIGDTVASSETSSGNAVGGGSHSFVFGAKIADRVTDVTTDSAEESRTGDETSTDDSNGDESKSADESKGTATPTVLGFASLAQQSGTANGFGEVDKKLSTELPSDELTKDDTLASSSASQPAEVKVTTGEEDERHLFQGKCKLHVLDPKDSSWHERGIGTLRVNQRKQSSSTSSAVPEMRIVMRVQGSLRVVLNGKLWPSMVVERVANQSKRLRVSVIDFLLSPSSSSAAATVTSGGDATAPPAVRFYLITMKSESDIDQLFELLTDHVRRLKDEEETKESETEVVKTSEETEAETTVTEKSASDVLE